MNELSHTDESGRAKMVDVGGKPDQTRIAVAEGFITLQENTLALIRDNEIKKGDVITVAEIAGIQAAKRTSDLIPLCHPLLLSSIEVKAELQNGGVYIKSRVCCKGQTGVEMEALTAVSTALLTIYDMCKAVDKNMQIKGIRLIEKHKQ
jgi:cyclic pyranopterin monophosphate synthase